MEHGIHYCGLKAFTSYPVQYGKKAIGLSSFHTLAGLALKLPCFLLETASSAGIGSVVFKSSMNWIESLLASLS